MSPNERSDLMATTTTVSIKPEPPASIELWDKQAVLQYFGGTKPLHLSTLYRGMASGIYPRPINVSANVVRWVADECRATTQRMLAARDEPKQPTGRGRKRGASAAKAKTAAEIEPTA
jgi:predicted DNA-binding transcriptional regulator AlpA